MVDLLQHLEVLQRLVRHGHRLKEKLWIGQIYDKVYLVCAPCFIFCVGSITNCVLYTDNYGRNKIHRTNTRKLIGFIKISYTSRALEWINLRKVFQNFLIFFQFSHLCSIVDDITFSWTYTDNLAAVFYKSSTVFKKFSFKDLLDQDGSYACLVAKRLMPFCDPLTSKEGSSFTKAMPHVQTMDMKIIQHPELRNALAQGLNHIPLRPTNIVETMAVIMDVFSQLYEILKLSDTTFPLEETRKYLHSVYLGMLKVASKSNKFGFKNSSSFLLDIPAVHNEIEWLQKHLFCLGLNKVENNACFLYIRHIRLQALERLMGPDFAPCLGTSTWLLPTKVLDQVT
jgi:hypothetical protein